MIFLDGIENSPNAYDEINKILSENDIHKKSNIFITYNLRSGISLPINFNEFLVYYLPSFLDNKKSLFELFKGYLSNKYLKKDKIEINDLSQKLTNVHMFLIKYFNKNDHYNIKINERIIISFCKNILSEEEDENLDEQLINNLLYFYCPSFKEEEKNNLINIIKKYLTTNENDFQENLKNEKMFEKNVILNDANNLNFFNKNFDPYFFKCDIPSLSNINLSKINSNINYSLSYLDNPYLLNLKCNFPDFQIIKILKMNKTEQIYVVSLLDKPNESYILHKILLNGFDAFNCHSKIIKILESFKTSNSEYIHQIKDYYIENIENNNKILFILEKNFNINNRKCKNYMDLKTAIKKWNINDKLWIIFIKIIYGLKLINSNIIEIPYNVNINSENIYIDSNLNIKFNIFNFISEYLTNNSNNSTTQLYSLIKELFGSSMLRINQRISIAEIFNEDFFIKKFLENVNEIISKSNFEKIVSYFNDLKILNVENLSFDTFELTCEKCKVLPYIFLKNKDTLLLKCEKCYLVKSEKIGNIRDKNHSLIKVSNLLISKINKYSKYFQKFSDILKYKYEFVQDIINNLTDKNELYIKGNKFLDDIVINIWKIYFNDIKIYNNLIYLYINVLYLLELNKIENDLIIHYENILEAIIQYFSDDETNIFKNSIKEEKEKFLLLCNRISNNEMEELKSIIKDIFVPNNSNISQIIKTKQYIEKNIRYTYLLKKYMVVDKILNPKKYKNIDEELNNYKNILANSYNSNNNFFILAVLAKLVENKGIKIFISQKEEKNLKNIELASIQSLLSFSNEIKYEFHLDLGKTKNELIFKDEIFKNTFIKNMKTKIARHLDIKEDELIIANIHRGSVIYDVYHINIEQEKLEKLESLLNDEEFQITEITKKPLLEALFISEQLLSSLGDRTSGWGYNEKRGGEDYIPPINKWIGVGLNVLNQYDNCDNSWLDYKNLKGEFAIAYIGLHNFFSDENNFSNYFDSINLSKALFDMQKKKLYSKQDNIRDNSLFSFIKKEKCGDGICVFQNPDEAENFAGIIEINNQIRIKIILMCRVNSEKIRQPKNYKQCWILNPTPEEIRPYRILIKKIPISPLIGTINTPFITALEPIDYIISAINSGNETFYTNLRDNYANCFTNSRHQNLKNDHAIIRFYTGEYCYFQLNDYLRRKKISDFSEEQFISITYCLQHALKINRNVEDNRIVYRGVHVKFPPGLNRGSRFYFREFTSCTTDINFARTKARPNGTLLEITIKNNEKNNYCFNIRSISFFENEDEILISSHCYYIVNDIQKEDDIDHVYLTCEGYFNFKIQDGEVIIG